MKNHHELVCSNCKLKFWRHNRLKQVYQNKSLVKRGLNPVQNVFCSKECLAKHQDTSVEMNCGWCNTKLVQKQAELNKSKSGLAFCNMSCAASYNNTKKRKSRRSKSEKLLFDLLVEKYSQLNILPNDKQLLEGYEVDIAIPSLNLAIEWNGIVHYKPIYGIDKLNKIKTRDVEKQILAENKKVRLVIVPDLVSNEKYVRESFVEICKIIDDLSVNL